LSARQRPSAISILVALQVLLGVLFLFGVFSLTVLRLSLTEVVPHVRLFPVRLFVVVVALLAFAAIEFVLAFGLWSRMSWAWWGSLAFAVLGIVFFVLSLFLRPGLGEIASLILDLLVLYYLMQPRVQAYFGQGGTTSS
jgi:uncharacterized membrane protein (DUF2068 family)